MTRTATLLLAIALTAALAFLLACADPDTLELVGTVERETLELAAPISEVIVELTAAEGDRVEAGQIVARLDADVATAELRAHEAGRAAAQAMLTEAQRDFERQKELRESRVVAQQAYDAARRRRDEALALVAEKEARITQATKRLENLTLRTRSAGVVDQLPFELGERVPAGGVVAVIVAEETPWVRVWLPARAAAKAKRGSAVRVEVEGWDEPFTGTLQRVAHESELTPHYALTERESAHLVYESRISLDDAPVDLRPGLAARVRLVLPKG